MQQVDDPPSLPVGTEVSAKYKGAFCEAKVSKVVRNIKVKVAYKQGLGSGIVSDDAIKAPTGQLRVGAVVEVRHPDRKETVEATITKIQDCSQYTVVFDDGDITTLRRTALCLKSGRHFNESETLDQLPLTHPEHFGNPVVGGRRGRRRGQLNEDSSDDDDESDAKEVVNEKEENIGKVVCVETESKKKDKEKWFPALVVAPTAQATVRIRVKDEYLVRSFKDGRYYTVPKKEATEFTREVASKQDVPAVQAALEFLDSSILPPHWDRDSLFGLSNLSSDDEGEIDSDSSDDEPHEEKDRFVAQLYKYMDDRGTPLNKVPSIQSRDVDLYRLFRAVQKRGGYNRVTSQNQWKLIAVRLGFTPCTVSVMNLVKQAYKKFLQPYGDFHRKLGCSMLMTSRNSNRSKGRSLVRANSVASPKPTETTKTETISKLAQPNQLASTSSSAAAAAASTPARAASTASQSAAEESENTSESSVVVEPTTKKQRKGSAASSQQGKVKSLVEKYEEKSSSGPGSGAAAARGASPAAATVQAATGPASTTSAPAAGGAASASGATTGSSSKDTEADLPLAKIKAAAAAAAATRHSAEKETNISSGSSASASSKANSAELQRSRDASPSVPGAPSATTGPATSQPTSTKKEKHQRTKQGEKDKDKDKEKDKDKDKDKDKEKDKEEKQASGSGKRKKEKISVEKIDTGDFVVGIGDKLKVNYHEKKSPSSHGSTYEAKVIEISVQRGVPMYLVHYTGWNNRYDEWVPRERIAENLTKGSKQKTRTVSTSSANSGSGGGGGSGGGSGGGGGGGSSGNGGGGSGTGSHSGQQPPGPGDKHLGGKDGSSKIPPSAGVSASGGGASGTGAPNMGGVISMPTSISGGALKTPHSTSSGTSSTASGAKRGRGRSDSMPPRSTTPSSVVSGANRTKSPAASQQHLQQQKKRPTRVPPGAANPRRPSDASMATESDSDSDEPVRRPKRQSAKEKPTPGSKSQAAQSSGKAGRMTTVTAPPPNASDDSDADEEEDTAGASGPTPEPAKQPRGSRAGGNRAMSSGAASTKGRDYDLSEIRSELKGFQPQLLTGEERKDVVVKSEPSTDPGQATVKKEPKVESSKSSSTELSSETESYVDEDSQSSDYRKQPKTGAKKEPPRKLSHHSEQQVSKREDQPHPGVKAEPKVEPKQEVEESTKSGKPFLSGPDIKPTTSSLIAPARFGTNLGAGGSGTSGSNSGGGPSVSAKYTSVIVEKPLTVGGKKSGEQHSAKKAELLKKPAGAALEAKKFAEPVASLKVELPAACSPSSSSSSSSSFCSSASGGSSSSATRSLPDMSKLEISSGTAAAPAGAPPGAPSQPPNPPASSSKETKYSSSSSSAATTSAGSSGLGMSKSLSSDVYEFKDTEPFEFEKRISPMAGTTGSAGSVLMPTGPVVAPSVFTNIMTTAPVVVGGGPARKQALKSIQQSQEPHQLPPAAGYSGLSGGQAPSKAKKRGSPLKEPPPGLEKPKIYKLDKEQVQQPQPQQQQQSPPNLKVNQPAGQVGTQIKIHTTPPGVGGGGGIPSASSPAQLAPPHHATPFDALRKSPSFNLNILALNEELAQTVQETTRALTDALQPPGPPPPATPPASGSSNVPPMSPVAPPVIPTPLATSSGPTCPSTPPAGGATVAPKLSTPPNPVKPAPAPHIVGSPFVETRNVFELSTSNEGSGYSSGEGSKDNKLEQLENVKILLAGATAVFGLDAGKQKTTSIADKVLKAISQKKEEVEQNKSKPPVAVPVPVVELPAKITAASGGTAAGVTGTVGAAGLPAGGADGQSAPPTAAVVVPWETMMLPLKIQTAGPLLGEIYRPGPATSSPETKSILESSLPAKNSELSETIQKLECAIQQRKTPVGGALSLASSTAGTPPAAHTPNSTVTAGAGGFSDESMDSTDSEQRLVIEDVIAEEQTTTTTTGEQKSPGSGQEDGLNVSTLTAETEATSSSDPAPVKLDVGGKAQPGIQAPIPVKLTESSFAGKLTAVTQQPPPLAKLQAAEAEGKAKGSLSSFGIPIVLPEIPASVVVLTPALMVASAAAAETSEAVMPAEMATVMRHSPGSPAQALASPKGFQPSPKLAESAAGGLLLKTYSTPMGTSLVAGVSGVPAGAPAAAANFQQDPPTPAEIPTSYIAEQDAGETSSTSSPVVARPFVMHAVGKEIFGNVVAPAASSPLIGDPHNESINLLCEETIPGSPAPLYGGKDDQLTNPALAGLSGIGPLPPDTPPPGAVPALQQQIQIQTTHPQQPGVASDSGRAAESEVIPSAVTSSPDSASQDESGEETKKHTEMEHDLEAGGLGVLNKRKRTRKQVPLSQAVAAQLQSLSKRRRQVSGMRNLKTTTTTAGSDTDDNSDNLAPSSGQTQQRQSARQQLMPQANPQQQQQQQAQAQHLAQQQAALQASLATSQSGVRPCPYNFLVELDPALSSDECITILRKQIQDLRKAYNTIKAELTVIDRRRKKLRRREREKKQHQLQSQQQGKICA